MKNKSISFEDRIYALIYQVYEFSKKTNKYDDKMFMILWSLFMLHKDFINSKKEYMNRYYDIENEFHKIEMDYKFDL